MVALSEVVAANQALDAVFPQGLTAVFVGGTSGVGEYTLKALAKAVPSPRIYLVGRSQDAADRIIQECQALQSDGHYQFIQADVSSLRSVDDVCNLIKGQVKGIDLLFLSQGSMAFDKSTVDGLPMATMLATHSRLRFLTNLLPLIETTEGLRRVVNVGAGTYEGAVDMNNLLAAGMPLLQWRGQVSSIMTLLLEETASKYPSVSFVHNTPGQVKSNVTRDAQGFGLKLTIGISKLLAPLIETPPEECAQRQLFQATSARYPGRTPDENMISIEGRGGEARSVDGNIGGGVYSIDVKCESASAKVVHLLEALRQSTVPGRIWEAYMNDFERFAGAHTT